MCVATSTKSFLVWFSVFFIMASCMIQCHIKKVNDLGVESNNLGLKPKPADNPANLLLDALPPLGAEPGQPAHK